MKNLLQVARREALRNAREELVAALRSKDGRRIGDAYAALDRIESRCTPRERREAPHSEMTTSPRRSSWDY